jgi:hypothetical protein
MKDKIISPRYGCRLCETHMESTDGKHWVCPTHADQVFVEEDPEAIASVIDGTPLSPPRDDDQE